MAFRWLAEPRLQFVERLLLNIAKAHTWKFSERSFSANSTKEEPPQTAASRCRESCGRTHKTFVVDYLFQGDGEKMKEKSCSTAEMQSGPQQNDKN
ncbi:unnamed protein product [Citrullus colocynthis]|uniref:Uncharacterized protein n=1 Tax=Citrullus colocynthis TaxID=252529 RepID=A0ABP0YE71_9ROSI